MQEDYTLLLRECKNIIQSGNVTYRINANSNKYIVKL